MNLDSWTYSEEKWRASVGHFPLRLLPEEDLLLLHRHWMWANQLREVTDQKLTDPQEGPAAGDAMLVTRGFGFMFIWYGMLWAVIEACMAPKEGREVDILGPFREDIDQLSAPLRRFRNAILHVPKSGEYVDPRIIALVRDPLSVRRIRRVHTGFGRLFLEELERRRQ
jgi:hypothetical protein